MQTISAQDIILQRLAANGLSRPFPDPLACVRSLAGIQSQFQQWAEISIMNRASSNAEMRDLAALYGSHAIINLWGQRHTLHMYVKEDWNTVSDVYEPELSGKNYAHSRHPDDFARLMECIREECAAGRTISRTEIQALVRERTKGGHPEEEYFDYTLIGLCCLRGIFFGLPEKPGIKTFVGRGSIHREPWQEDAARAEEARRDLMLRYFRHYGPATLADFRHWSGLPAGASRRCLEALKERFAVHSHAGREYYSCPEPEGVAQSSDVFLLGKFDPLFVSYKHKDWIIPAGLEKQVWRSAGWVEAVVIEGSGAVGTWRHTLKGSKMSLAVSPFAKIKAATRRKIQARAEALALFWGKTLDSVAFG